MSIAESAAERTAVLLDRVRAGQEQALGELFTLYRDRLWQMPYVRLDRRLASRASPDDVLQEAFLHVACIREALCAPTAQAQARSE